MIKLCILWYNYQVEVSNFKQDICDKNMLLNVAWLRLFLVLKICHIDNNKTGLKSKGLV